MRANLAATAIALTASALLAGAAAAQSGATKYTWAVGAEGPYQHYEEPSLNVSDQGPFVGVTLEAQADIDQWMMRVDGRFAYGNMEYDGSGTVGARPAEFGPFVRYRNIESSDTRPVNFRGVTVDSSRPTRRSRSDSPSKRASRIFQNRVIARAPRKPDVTADSQIPHALDIGQGTARHDSLSWGSSRLPDASCLPRRETYGFSASFFSSVERPFRTSFDSRAAAMRA